MSSARAAWVGSGQVVRSCSLGVDLLVSGGYGLSEGPDVHAGVTLQTDVLHLRTDPTFEVVFHEPDLAAHSQIRDFSFPHHLSDCADRYFQKP